MTPRNRKFWAIFAIYILIGFAHWGYGMTHQFNGHYIVDGTATGILLIILWWVPDLMVLSMVVMRLLP